MAIESSYVRVVSDGSTYMFKVSLDVHQLCF